MTPNKYGDTFWVQNELTLHNLHLRTECCGNLAKITPKNHEIHKHHTWVKLFFFCTVSPPQQTPKTNFQIWVLQVIYRHKHNVYNWNFSHQMVVLKIYVPIYFLGWNAYVIKFLKFFITVMMTWISHHSKCYFGKLAPSFPLSISGRKCI